MLKRFVALTNRIADLRAMTAARPQSNTACSSR